MWWKREESRHLRYVVVSNQFEKDGILYPFPKCQFKLLKYTVLGGMAFLLILEGGRSRYLIQFLPYIIMLSAYGWSHIRIVLSKKSYWVKEKVDVCQRH